MAGCGAGAGKGQVRLESFEGLGSYTRLADLEPAELGTADAEEFQRTLERARLKNLDEVRAALSFVPPADRRGFAFAVPGCAADSAVLTVERDTLTAELTGGENVNCVQANYFLAVFSVDRGSIPPTPTLLTMPR
ncbi:hypothetical protein H074_12167 [Amycolatopsis decaplanina DSM 44594]|uniref:Uncharacterized protein n=1 Tax=Amycolatopsis decaplanina DSM 44594 TaxID=1284240 RepID=M2ZIY3_9PSEU|nr:hypothetical protein H074_12167 [Amycolatopsis decaplanina DSM 44594]